MTPEPDTDLARIIDRTATILLDFDGPICSIFANHTATAVAANLRSLLAAHGSPLPPDVPGGDDPLEVLRATRAFSPALVDRVEASLRAAEVRASRSAEPTPGSREVMHACAATGRTVAVVSNNSEEAIAAYLSGHDLMPYVALVVGRAAPDPALLKPSPYMVRQAVDGLLADPASCTLVGDSTTDITSAREAGVRAIGYANKPGKRPRLIEAGASAVVGSMTDLARVLRASNCHV